MNRFQLTTTLCYGADALGVLRTYRGGRAFVVTDAFIASTALFERVIDELGAENVQIFDQVRPNPDSDAVSAAASELVAWGADLIVAVGGGSPIDTAKLVRKVASELGHQPARGFITVPTTSGSGSEVTSYAVLSDTARKVPLRSADLMPDLAVLDAAAVSTAPAGLTADAGMDAVSHAIEAAVARGHNDFSDALAEKSLRLADQYLLRCVRDGSDLEAREHQHHAATMAGAAFENAGLGIVHGLSHALGGAFGITHGRLNAMLMPAVIEFNAAMAGPRPGALSPVAERYAALAAAIGLTASTRANLVRALSTWVQRLRGALAMPATLSEYGLNRTDVLAALPRLAETAMSDFCTPGNPVDVSAEDLIGVLRRVL
ncbi:MAG: iron-containing alcohol dehydrogenase [Arachnia sp.]